MQLMYAMLASESRFVLANIFAPLRELYLTLDTIPKPGGLGFGRPARRAVAPKVNVSNQGLDRSALLCESRAQ